MLLVVSPNLAVDRILEVHQFRANHVQRSGKVSTQAGGKGSNVARVFRQLGGEVVLIGFVGRRNADWIIDPLQRAGIHMDAIQGYDGESRTCTIIRDPASNSHPTVINEESPQVEQWAIQTFDRKIDEWLGKVDAVLMAGSLSRGLPEDFYAGIIGRATARNVFTAMDAAGSVMRLGLEAKPDLLKANLEEMGGVFGGPLPQEPTAIAKYVSSHSPARQTIVTLGEAGAILAADGTAWHAKPPRISKVNPIGAGDSFAAGYLKKLMEGAVPADAMRFAVAVAASDAATPEPGVIIPAEIDSLFCETELKSA